MPKNKPPEELSIEELRQLIVEKRRKTRGEQLERFRRTGRAINLAPDQLSHSLDLPEVTSQTYTEDQEVQTLRKPRIKPWMDRLLFGIEVLAVIGLLFVVYSGVKMLRDLNAQFTQSLAPPTLTPTALIVPLILPSGHTPPNSPGGVQPNDAEIPAHLRPLYQTMAAIPIPTSGPQQATQIQIPALTVDAPVVQGDGWEQLKKGVAQHVGSADPGQTGNVVLSAHNDVYGEIFRNLDQLKRGDKVILFTPQRSYTYIVSSIQIVAPTDVDVMAATPDPIVTLISCYPYMVDTQRIVVQASLQTSGN